MTYPSTLKENVEYRKFILTECEKDVKFAGKMRELFRRDVLFAFNTFFFAFDPMVKHRHGLILKVEDRPIVTYPYQDEAILFTNESIEIGENQFVDKSRDMLATYTVLCVYLWRWLSKPNQEFRIGSRKEEYVDKNGDRDTLFEKLRYNLSMLPYFILPSGWAEKKHSTYMRLFNPEMRSVIIGEATNESFARGGRKTSVLFDEFQDWEKADEAWRSATDSTRCKIVLGTPKGSGNKFAELARTDEVSRKLRLLWWKHPEKTFTSKEHILLVKNGKIFDKVTGRKVVLAQDQSKSPVGCYVGDDGRIHSEWYDDECKRRTKEDILENIDCNYLTTGNPVFDSEKCNKNMMNSEAPLFVGNLIWKIRPVFNENGDVTNLQQLEVEFLENRNGMYSFWEMPIKGWDNGYCISADVAEGLEQGDFNSASCLRRFPLAYEDVSDYKPKMVCRLHGHLKTFEYAEELAKFGIFFGKCWVAPERTGLGLSVVDQLWKLYRKIYHKEVMTKGYPERTDKLGWDTTSQSKGHIITNLSKKISEDAFIDLDERLWKETMTFVNDDGKMEAQGKSRGQKCFDDIVMETAICHWVHEQLPSATRQREVQSLPKWKERYFEQFSEGGSIGFAIR